MAAHIVVPQPVDNTLTQLPVELWLDILKHVPLADLWPSVRRVNHHLRVCAEEQIRTQHVQRLTVGMDLTQLVFVHPAIVTLKFVGFNQRDKRYALFSACRRGEGSTDEVVRIGEKDREQEWRVRCGKNAVRVVHLKRAALSPNGGLWADWKELFSALCQNKEDPMMITDDKERYFDVIAD